MAWTSNNSPGEEKIMAMNPLLAQIYNTHEKLASQAEPAQNNEEASIDEFVFEELQKTAAAQQIDLSQLSDEDLQSVFETYKAELIKEASAAEAGDDGQLDAAQQEAISAGDLMGRAAAHAFYAEAAEIQAQQEMREKLAGLSDEEILDSLAVQRAENILAALSGNGEGFMKEAAMEITPDLEELDDLITMRAAEILDANDYDVDAIASVLEA